MTDLYMDQPGSKKKYLVPLVILLLCAVSLTGAGFAYNATTTHSGEYTDDAVLLLINGNDDKSITFEFDVDWKSEVVNNSATWTINSDNTAEFTMAYKKTTAAAYEGDVLVSIDKMHFAYTLTIGNFVKNVAAGEAVVDFVAKVGESAAPTTCTIAIAEGAATDWQSATDVPENTIAFTIKAVAVAPAPANDDNGQ